MPSQWQYDMGSCGGCFFYPGCDSRKRILAVLSSETNKLNFAPADGAAGNILVQCKRGQVTPQCTAEMTQCITCPKSEICDDRKALQPALSQLCHRLNTGLDDNDQPAEDPLIGGVTNVVILCRRS